MHYEEEQLSEPEEEAEDEERLEAEERGRLLGGRLRSLIGTETPLVQLPDELIGETLLADTDDLDLLFPGQQSGPSGGKKRRRRDGTTKKRKKKKKSKPSWYENDLCYALTWVAAHLEPFLSGSPSSSPPGPSLSLASSLWNPNPKLSKLVPSATWSTVGRSRLGPFCTIPPPSRSSYPVVCKTLDAPNSTDKPQE